MADKGGGCGCLLLFIMFVGFCTAGLQGAVNAGVAAWLGYLVLAGVSLGIILLVARTISRF
jgi:hypothetical protein